MYTDTGFWDTFRCLFPLLNLVYPSVNAEIQAGLANAYRESGFLPEWASPGHRGCMVGNNSASVVADADPERRDARQRMSRRSTRRCVCGTRQGASDGKLDGTPGDTNTTTRWAMCPTTWAFNENAARTLEYAYDDWCIAAGGEEAGPARRMRSGLEDGASRNYRNLFDPETRLMRGPQRGRHVPVAVQPLQVGRRLHRGQLVALHMVGVPRPRRARRPDGRPGTSSSRCSIRYSSCRRSTTTATTACRIHEITEMQVANMGNYAHGNQPAQHMIYLYNYVGASRGRRSSGRAR